MDFSTLAHDTLGIIRLATGVVTTLRTNAKNSVRELIDFTTYNSQVDRQCSDIEVGYSGYEGTQTIETVQLTAKNNRHCWHCWHLPSAFN